MQSGSVPALLGAPPCEPRLKTLCDLWCRLFQTVDLTLASLFALLPRSSSLLGLFQFLGMGFQEVHQATTFRVFLGSGFFPQLFIGIGNVPVETQYIPPAIDCKNAEHCLTAMINALSNEDPDKPFGISYFDGELLNA